MKTILLVEDNDDMRENTAELLELSQFTVLPAKNYDAGLTLASKNKPDLIICDTDVPGLDRFKKLIALSAMGSMVPFIFLAAQLPEPNRNDVAVQGAGFLAKPFKADDLLNAVNKYISA
ncbi:MAG TPA: response regulator [Chitinophagaceae bacterium]|nr:response regulator [Chitinophagaceae bacterium]